MGVALCILFENRLIFLHLSVLLKTYIYIYFSHVKAYNIKCAAISRTKIKCKVVIEISAGSHKSNRIFTLVNS